MDRYALISWFTLLVAPSDCGWYAVVRFDLIFNSFNSSWNVWAANLGSLSEIISSGNPNLLKRLSRKSVTVPSHVIVFAQGHKITPFERTRSTTTRIESYPFTSGRSVIKPSSIWQTVLCCLLLQLQYRLGWTVIGLFWIVDRYRILEHNSLQMSVVLATSSFA
jgi:hypothetical protein